MRCAAPMWPTGWASRRRWFSTTSKPGEPDRQRVPVRHRARPGQARADPRREGTEHQPAPARALREYGPTGSAQSWRLWIEGWSAGLRNPVLRGVIATLDERWRGVITELIAEGWPPAIHTRPARAAWRISALIDGLAVQRVAFDDAVSPSDAEAWLNVALQAELGLDPA